VSFSITATNTTRWMDDHEAAQRRIFKRALAISGGLHLLIGLLFMVVPKSDPMRLPEVISVRMVSLPQLPAGAVPKVTTPKPLPAKPRPPPVPKKVVLPKQPSASLKKSKRKPKPDPLEYDDALAALRAELGEETPPPEVQETEQPMSDLQSAQPDPSAAEADPEMLAWRAALERHVRMGWKVPPDFKGQALRTGLMFTLTSGGEILGTPEVIQPSGNPYYDDSTVNALIQASPLPPPPEPGEWTFRLSADEN
jgi:outer membrane biosynthesis protein TonB